jgi:Protein of unknown function (DUF3237)
MTAARRSDMTATLVDIPLVDHIHVEHLCDFSIDFEGMQQFQTPRDIRLNATVKSGRVEGPRIRGDFLPGGGDWIVVGSDRVAVLDVRATIKTDGGEHIFVTNPSGAVIRDQAPMPSMALARCLYADTSSADWYALVNQGVFFWCDRARLERHRAAQHTAHAVLALDSRSLAGIHGDAMFVTAFYTGAALRRAAARGPRSFVALDAWQRDGWAAEYPAPARPRRRGHAPAELVIRGVGADVLRHVVEIDGSLPSHGQG